MHSDPRPATRGAFLCFLHMKKPSPVGEGGSRRLTDEESFLFIVNTSSTAYAVPLPPLGKAIQFYRLFCGPSGSSFFISEKRMLLKGVAPTDVDRGTTESDQALCALAEGIADIFGSVGIRG